jgi:diacylglycerol kinase (ATP)
MPSLGPLLAPRAQVLANPKAGGGRNADAFQAAIGALAAGGWTVSLDWTSAPGAAEPMARAAAAKGIDVVVAAGGDGTVNEVVNGLAHTGTALAVLPMGTGNVLAAQLGLVGVPTPLYRPDLVAAAQALANGRLALVDTGLARAWHGPARRFMLWAGVGFDAALALEMETTGRTLKRRFGPLAYGALGFRAVLGAGGTPALVVTENQRVRDRLLMAVVANIGLYAGAVDLSPNARLDDGALNLELFLGERLRQAAAHLAAVLIGRGGRHPDRVSTPARRVRIVAQRPLAVHLDAEPFGTTPMRFDADPASLRLVVPATAPVSLFTHLE